MKTPDQHLRLIALPAALAFALVGCERGGESKDGASESESQAAVESGSSQTRESVADPANDFKTGSSPALAPAELQTGGKVIVADRPALQGPTRSGAGLPTEALSDIVLEPAKLDLGRMQPGVPKTGIVKLTNHGSNSVQIKKAIPGCGCTTPTWPREPIGPGETAEIEITLKPSTKQGQRLNKKVTLEMMAGPPHSITVAGEVGVYVKMSPDFLDSALQENDDQRVLVLTSVDEVPFSVVKVDPPVLMTGVGGEKALKHEMKIDWTAWDASGRRKSIKLVTDHPDAPELAVAVRRAIVRDRPLPPPRSIRTLPVNRVVAAAMADDVNGVAAAMAAGEDLDGITQGGMTALHWAAKKGNSEILAMLIEGGANLDSLNALGKTPVVLAAESGQLKALELLVANGGRIDTIDEIGGTPLLWAAAMSKNPATVGYLLEQGAEVDVVDTNGMTPLIWAAGIGDPGSVKVLLDHGADLDLIEIHQQENALMRAARIGKPESLQALIEAKPDLEVKNLRGETALIIAASSAPKDKIQMLVDAGADLQVRDIRHWSVLDHAQARTDRNRAAVIAYFRGRMGESGSPRPPSPR